MEVFQLEIIKLNEKIMNSMKMNEMKKINIYLTPKQYIRKILSN